MIFSGHCNWRQNSFSLAGPGCPKFRCSLRIQLCSSWVSCRNMGPCFRLAKSIICCSWLGSLWCSWSLSSLGISWILWFMLLMFGWSWELSEFLSWLLVSGHSDDGAGSPRTLFGSGHDRVSRLFSSVVRRIAPWISELGSAWGGSGNAWDTSGFCTSANTVMLTLAECPFFRRPFCDRFSQASQSSTIIISVFLWMHTCLRKGA